MPWIDKRFAIKAKQHVCRKPFIFFGIADGSKWQCPKPECGRKYFVERVSPRLRGWKEYK